MAKSRGNSYAPVGARDMMMMTVVVATAKVSEEVNGMCPPATPSVDAYLLQEQS